MLKAVRGVFFCVGAENLQFDIGKQDIGRQLGSLTAQQSHQHDAPRDDKVDRNGAPDTLGGLRISETSRQAKLGKGEFDVSR